MQGVRARVTPVAIEIVLDQGGPGTGELEELVRRGDGDLGAEHLGLSHGNLSLRDSVSIRIFHDTVHSKAGFLQKGFGGV
jgi:hypothetical protein